MTATHSTVSTLLVAIDISKHRHEVLIGIPGKKRRRRMTVMNTLEDFRRLATALAGYGRGWKCERGFSQSDEGCTAIVFPANTHLDRSGNRWNCNRNFRLT